MKSKRLVILFLSLFALMLAACGEVKQEVWLIGNEQWKLDLALTLNSQEYSAIGATLDKQMADSQAKARQEGADFTWSKRRESGGGATYTVSVKGRGLDTLNEAAFDNQARLTRDRSGQVNLSWTPTSKSG